MEPFTRFAVTEALAVAVLQLSAAMATGRESASKAA
jgi:hypothetical protein